MWGSSHTARHSATDMFGLGIPNPCIVADYIAEATGFSVYVPDLLEGQYASAPHTRTTHARYQVTTRHSTRLCHP